MGLETAVIEYGVAMPVLAIMQVENMPAAAPMPEVVPVAEQSTLQETPVALDLQAATAKIQQEGGIDAHTDRHNGDPRGCPFRDIIGTIAGRQLIESMAKPDRPPTMAERVAARRAEQTVIVTAPKKQSATEVAPKPLEAHQKVSPQTPSVSEQDAVQRYDIVVKSTIDFETPSPAAVGAETPPVSPAIEPSVRPLSLAPGEQQFVALCTPLPEISAVAEAAEIRTIASRPVDQTIETVRKITRTVETIDSLTAPNTLTPAPIAATLSVAEQRAVIMSPFEAPPHPTDIMPPVDSAPLPAKAPLLTSERPLPLPVAHELPVIASAPYTFEVELAPIAAIETAKLPETPAMPHIVQVAAFEAVIAEWLCAETPQNSLAESSQAEPAEQSVADAPSMAAATATAPEIITPPVQLEAAAKVKVIAILEAITQAVAEIQQPPEAVSGAPSAEILEALCVELFAVLGSRPDDETIRAIVSDILSRLPVLADDHADAISALPVQGTHEYKTTLAASLFAHFAQAVQRRARQVASVSRYMVAHISSPFQYRFVDAPAA